MKQINFTSLAMVKTILVLGFILTSITQGLGQRLITGSTSVLVGSTEQYTITAPSGKIPSLVITLSNRGSASYPSQDPYNSSIYYIDVYWHTVGTDQIKVFDQDDIAIVTSPTITINGQAVGPVSISGGVTSRCMGSGSTTFSASASNATSYSWSITSGAGSISNGIVTWSPSFSGIATISVTAYGAGGSSSNSSKNVTVNAPGTISITSNQPWQICQGTYARLTASGGTSYYEWDVVSSEGSQHFSGVNYIDVNPNVNTTYYLYGNESICNSAQSTSQTITVVPLPVIQGEINPSGFSTRCQGNGSDSFSVVANNASSYTWSVNPPSAGTMSGSTINWSNSFSGTAVITVNAFGCNSSSASKSKSIIVAALPSAANAGPDQVGATTCGASSVSLAANIPTVGSGAWSIISGSGGYFVIPGTLTSPNSTTSFTGVAGSSYTLRWSVSNSPCASNYDDVVITFNRNPTAANAGPDQTSSATCGLTSVTLAGNAPAIGAGVWNIVSGTGGYFVTPGITTSTNRTSSFNGVSGSTYTLRWTISNSPCTSSIDDMVVTFNANPTVANAGPDQTSSATCGLTSVTLAANAPSIGSGNWTIVSGTGGYFVTPGAVTSTNATSSFSGVAGSTYTLRWSISNLCSTSTDDVIVTFNRTPTISNAGVDQTGLSTCGLTTITLAGNAPTIGSGVWSIISGTGGYFVTQGIVTSTNRTSTFSGVSGSTYTLRWTISNAPCAASIDDVLIKFNSSATVANAGPDQINSATCGLTSVTLTANAPTAGTGSWSIVSGTGGYFVTPGVITSTNRTSSFSGVAGSAYTLRWTITNSLCQSIDDVNITFNKNPLANAGVDLSVWAGTNNVIGGSPTAAGGIPPYTYAWNPSTGLTSSVFANPTATANSSNTYTVTITDSKSCQHSDAMLLSVTAQPIITASGTTIVLGSSVQLEGNTGFTTYQWLKNGTEVIGNVRQISVNAPAQYTLKVTKTGVTGFGTASINIQAGANDENYILTNNPLIEIYNTANLATVDVNQFARSIQYFDGLGRPMQAVTTQGSPGMLDIVQPIVYDSYGRESKKYLPFVAQNNGAYKPNDQVIDVATGNYKGIALPFYSTGAGKVAQDNRPFSETFFEPSPLNRPDKEYGVGQAWAPTGAGSNNKFIQHAYLINSHSTGSSATQEKVIAWIVNGSNMPVRAAVLTNYVITGGYYASNQLNIKSTKDEQGNEVREYSDKQGRVILKKVQAATSTDLNNLTQWALTYYVYDDLGNLRFVFPPELSKLIHSNVDTYPVSTTDLNNWAFQYTYDGRKRMITKQVPGAGVVYMIYDNRDRLVLTQDANQRATATKYWSFTKYDQLNRPILTGIKDTTASLTQLQMQDVVNLYYNNMTSTTWRSWSETYVGNITGNVHSYTNKAYPVRTGAASEIDVNKYLSVTYYDNYSFRDYWYGTYIYLDEDLNETVNGQMYDQPDVENLRVMGQVTGTKTKVLDGISNRGGAVWLRSVNYYDDKYRVVQSFSDNVKGGIDRTTNVYDFVGKVLKSKSSHEIAYDIVWSEINNLVLENKRLYKPTSVPQGNGNNSAVSLNTLSAGQDGWVEFTINNLGLADNYGREFLFAGLTTNKNNAITTGFVFYLISDNTLSLYVNGVRPISVIGYNKGDVFRISREGTNIKFYHNYKLLYTATGAPTAAMVMDIDVFKWNCGVLNARASFGGAGVNQQISKTTTRKFEYDHAGRLLKTWHQVDSGPNILLTFNEYNELGQLVDKKLHSTVSTGANAKQSVDYRYNIRGWLTSMNDASLANTTSTTKTNDDTGDLFGMNLAYNETTLGIGNNALFNGNISGMAWSNNLGVGTTKQNAYTYTYDAMNRILSSAFKEKTASWSAALNNYGLSEAGFTYDLNGNIKTLKRNDRRGTGLMDDLVYDYGYTGIISNKLLRVTDNGDPNAGFIDGNPGTSYDYEYDPNGNLKKDLNKGIASSAITYNYLNLPETVTKGNNSIRYIYDASGRKLTQVTTFGGQQKQVDYAGEFQYENDVLQFISHEEGRIAIANNKTIVTHNGDNTTNITAVTSALAAVTANGTNTYVKATASGTTTKQGMFPIGGTITVAAGEQYRIRAKGYRTATNANMVHLYIRTNSTDLNWPGAQLPSTSTSESYVEQVITIPVGHTTLQAGVVWNTVANGEQFFLNEFEITKLTTNTTPEYQYNLKDHLGNVRLTFTSKDDVDVNTATLETANLNTEQSQFLRIDNAKRINASIFDRTNGAATGYAERLNGSANEKYGVAKSISVMPGDVITAEVYAKYVDPTTSNWTGALTTLMSQIAANTAGVVVDGAAYASSTTSFPSGFAGLQSTNDTGAPRAYLNWLVFDRNYGFITGGFKQIGTTAKEAGSDVPHELLQMPAPITITQPGYVYIYLSNENPITVEVYFDDFKVTHTKSPVIQSEDYYPFGLTFNSYRRENSVENKIRFQGQEHVDDLNLGWDSFKWRNHQPEIGRFFNVDPLADKYVYNSPYAFSENHVTVHIELEGLEKVYIFDQADRPQDNGTAGTSYTAKVYVLDDTKGTVNGPYSGSSYPNSKSNTDNSTNSNTLKTGEHAYNNESGHSGGTKQGLNIVNADGDREAPGTSPGGVDVTMTNVNAHEGKSDNGNYNSRGSEGCITIAPTDSGSFFGNFDWSGANGKTGNSSGTITVHRGDTQESKLDKLKVDLLRVTANQLNSDGIYVPPNQ